MSTIAVSVVPEVRVKPRTPDHATRLVPAIGPVAAPQLDADLERLRAEEQARVDRERQATLARLQELARFD